MMEETAVRVEISAARFASQSILDILRLTVLAMQGRSYGQQSLAELNRQNRQLASVDVNDRTLRLVKRQLNQYSVDFSVTKDKDSGRMYLWFKGQDVDRIQTALENCIAERGQERRRCRSFPHGWQRAPAKQGKPARRPCRNTGNAYDAAEINIPRRVGCTMRWRRSPWRRSAIRNCTVWR